jgi:hypothetical protein
VCQQQVVDRVPRDSQNIERGKQIGHGVIRADIHEGSAAAVLNDMRRRMSWMNVLRIDGGDAVRMTE